MSEPWNFTPAQQRQFREAHGEAKREQMADAQPQRVDPPGCGCTDCLTGYSVPLNLATWQTVKAMVGGDVQDATSTELDVMVVVTPANERGWKDGQVWKWKAPDHKGEGGLTE
jgi:hypothetical protein